MLLKAEYIEYIKQFMVNKLNPYLVIVFGSAANERMRSDSDIDVAYLSDQNVQAYELFMLAQEMAGSLGRDVHLVDLRQVSTVLQAQIISQGKVILDLEPLKRQEFFILVLKQYARLNEERFPILAKIKERGSVYVR
jgi:predicted nucleotidyltransferase